MGGHRGRVGSALVGSLPGWDALATRETLRREIVSRPFRGSRYGTAGAAAAEHGNGGGHSNPQLKTSVYTEQGDDTEVLPAELHEVALWLTHYHDGMESEPPAECEPTADQLAVLNAKVKSEVGSGRVAKKNKAHYRPGVRFQIVVCSCCFVPAT